MKPTFWGARTVALLVLLAIATESHGAQLAFDSAADPAYDGGWGIGSNGGSGWGGGWSFPGSTNLSFIGSSATNGAGDPNADGDINTPRSAAGRAWGLQQQGTLQGTIRNDRPFNGNLLTGQTFKIDMDSGTTPAGMFGSWTLLGRTATTLHPQFTLFYGSTAANYLIDTGAGTTVDTGVPITDQGIHCEFTLTGPDTYSLTLTPVATGVPSGPILGTLQFPGEPVNILELTATKNSTAASAEYFNNIAITPEPASSLVLWAGAIALLGPRARRRG